MIHTKQIQYLFSTLPGDIFNIPNWFIAGGSVTSGEYNDIDIFFETEAAYLAVKELFLPTSYYIYDTTENAITFKQIQAYGTGMNIQLIHRSFLPIDQTLANFDLNVCRKAILPSGKLYTLPESNHPLYIDISNLRASSISRLLKYTGRGFITGSNKFAELIHYLVSNLDLEIPGYYNNDTMNCYRLLLKILTIPSLAAVASTIIDHYPESERAELYSIFLSYDYAPDPSLSPESQVVLSASTLDYATDYVIASHQELFL